VWGGEDLREIQGVLDGWGLKIGSGFKELRKWKRERGCSCKMRIGMGFVSLFLAIDCCVEK
jgi:hypothetical protein